MDNKKNKSSPMMKMVSCSELWDLWEALGNLSDCVLYESGLALGETLQGTLQSLLRLVNCTRYSYHTLYKYQVARASCKWLQITVLAQLQNKHAYNKQAITKLTANFEASTRTQENAYSSRSHCLVIQSECSLSIEVVGDHDAKQIKNVNFPKFPNTGILWMVGN